MLNSNLGGELYYLGTFVNSKYSGETTYTFDVSSYANYKNLTKDNFLVGVSDVTLYGTSFGGVTKTESHTYDSNSGILTVNLPYALYGTSYGAKATIRVWMFTGDIKTL